VLYTDGERDADRLRAAARSRLALAPDYLELRRRDDLGPYDPSHPAVLLVAAVIGTTRLIDNRSLEDA
jgi:pantothenate synthetase